MAGLNSLLDARTNALAPAETTGTRVDRLNGSAPSGDPSSFVSAFASLTSGTPIRLSGSLAAIDQASGAQKQRDLDIWFNGTFGVLGSSATGEFGMATMGLDGLLTDDVLLGLSLQLDTSRITQGNAELQGSGWLMGPYLTARVAPDLYVDLSASAGLSQNSISLGNSLTAFGGQRWRASGALLGDWQSGAWGISPELRFSWYSESTDPHAGPTGPVPRQDSALGRVALGPTVRYRFGLGDLDTQARVKVSTQLDSIADRLVLSLGGDAGLSVNLPHGANLDLGVSLQGLTQAHSASISWRAGLSGRLP
jgi:hypothetical protein